jgi:hypothetical protein
MVKKKYLNILIFNFFNLDLFGFGNNEKGECGTGNVEDIEEITKIDYFKNLFGIKIKKICCGCSGFDDENGFSIFLSSY